MNDLENSFSSEEEVNHAYLDESQDGFAGRIAIKNELLKKVNNTKLTLKEQEVFKRKKFSLSLKLLSRPNEIMYFVRTIEHSIDIKDTEGSVYLPLITHSTLEADRKKFSTAVRPSINFLHLGAIKIMLKAHFREGINSPIKMALYDDRLNHAQDKILGKAKGNLAYGKFIFTVYPKYGISLTDTNLNKVLSFVHKFERENFMEKGSKAFSITYVIAYALTNSHHSIDYSNEKTIDLENIFQEIGDVNSCKFAEIDDSNDNNWAIDIAKNKRLIGQKPLPLIKSRKSYTGETSSDATQSLSMRSMSLKIDSLRQELQSILHE